MLFVDDEPNVLSALARLTRESGCSCSVETASSAEAALKLIQEKSFDVIVTDYRMPKMDGLQLLARIKRSEDTTHIPVLMLTASTEHDVRTSALEWGALEFLTKPIDPAEFILRLSNVCRIVDYNHRLAEKNRELEAQMTRIQRLEIVGCMAAGIVHDLNNFLGAVVGNVELALADVDTDAMRQRLELVLGSSQQAGKLVQHILRLGTGETGDEHGCDLAFVARQSVQLLSATITDAITVDLQVGGGPHIVRPLRVEMHQILMNLMINGVHAMPDGGVLTVSLTSDEGRPGVVRLSVSDTGDGIPDDIRSRIFQPLFTTKAPGVGTGLGLAVVKRIVESHGGTIGVASAPGKGTSFAIELPLQTDDDTAAVVEVRAAAEQSVDG